MRPIYETQDTTDRARAAAQHFLEHHWATHSCHPTDHDTVDYELQPLPSAYPADYAIVRRSTAAVVAMLEVKCRNQKVGDFDTYLLALQKASKLVAMAQWTQTLLLVDYRDGQWAYQFSSAGAPGYLFASGRSDRGDAADSEPCVFLPKTWGRVLAKEISGGAGSPS